MQKRAPATVSFVTFGCRLNQAEALDLEASYAASGWKVVPEGGDRIVVRGCSVTAGAQRDCEKAIARLRREHPASEILVTGCLPGAVSDSAPPPRTVALSRSRAYLKVQDGCSGRCAFCIVPHFRGPPVSVPFGNVLARARMFLDAGFTEIVVTGCNLALYRSEGIGLPGLLAALAELPSAGHRVRLGSLEPGICDGALLDVFATHANLCPFLHLSLQSASPDVLRAMNRPYGISEVAMFCGEARRRLGPRLFLGADVIAGFPGETEADFALTRAFLADFAGVHAFPYSERPGTPAAGMSGRVSVAVRRERARILAREGEARKKAFAASLVGEEVEVCVERDLHSGLTAEGLRAELEGTYPRRMLVRTNRVRFT